MSEPHNINHSVVSEKTKYESLCRDAFKRIKKPLISSFIVLVVPNVLSVLGLADNWCDRLNIPPEYPLVYGVVLIIITPFCMFSVSLCTVVKKLQNEYKELKDNYDKLENQVNPGQCSDSIWGEAIIRLKDAYSKIHAYRRRDGRAPSNISDTQIREALEAFCNNIKVIFDKLTGATCCVSIKVLMKENESEQVGYAINIARDSSHKFARDTDEYKKITHRIFENTAFLEAMSRMKHKNANEIAYVNNNVPDALARNEYKTTSNYPKGIPPYKSELVFPLKPISQLKAAKMTCAGFFCIDSDKIGTFAQNNYEAPMIEGVADGIYDVVSDCQKWLHQKNKRSEKPKRVKA
ncbi:MAG: hypothetical protein FWH21_02530 [Kiritimatiellaeota bacterium]|nr:hypothetical protein [Kiritimatiellota bacterium]